MNNITWMPQEEYEKRKIYFSELQRRVDHAMLFGVMESRIPKEEDNVKLAYVIINGNRQMIGVDNKNYKGYKLEETMPTVKLPLEEISYDKFSRWCTNFDV